MQPGERFRASRRSGGRIRQLERCAQNLFRGPRLRDSFVGKAAERPIDGVGPGCTCERFQCDLHLVGRRGIRERLTFEGLRKSVRRLFTHRPLSRSDKRKQVDDDVAALEAAQRANGCDADCLARRSRGLDEHTQFFGSRCPVFFRGDDGHPP